MNINGNEFNQTFIELDFFGEFFKENLSPYSSIYIKKGDYIIKTATNLEEVKKSLELRHKVFFNSKNIDKKKCTELEWDKYDYKADHLIILNKNLDVIGSYRLISDLFAKTFYSETEFSLDHFKNYNGLKLEVGRACVHPDFRNGVTIDLLWRGILKYAQKNKIRYLFGVSSIWEKTHEEAYLLQKVMEKYYGDHTFKVSASPEAFNLENIIDTNNLKNSNTKNDKDFLKMIPALLKGYIRAGSKVCGPAIYDPSFKCHDFLTILDLNLLSPIFVRRYFKK